MRASDIAAALMLAAVLMFSGFAVAQDKAAREREALVRAQRAVAKLQQENAALGRERGEIAARLETAAKELADVKGDAVRARGRAAATEKELGPLREERDALKQKLEAAEKQLAQTVLQCSEARQSAQQTQQRLEGEGAALDARLKQQTTAQQTCAAANDKLYALTRELSQQYERAARERAEPIFGLRLVEIENQMQDYRDRADESKLPPARKP